MTTTTPHAPLDLVSTQEAARILNRSPQRVRQLADAGDLVPVARVGDRRQRLYARADVEHLAQLRAAQGTKPRPGTTNPGE
jgi:DNA-binding transcriptional MerR regulator